MSNNKGLTERHYTATNLFPSILNALKAAGKDISNLSIEDLAPVDEFHIRGVEATKELAGLIKINPGYKILDIGCGLGGSARHLASNYGCHITGIDITQEYCKTAAKLSHLVKLEDKTGFCYADATKIPFENESFNIVWSEHVQMNIENKLNLYKEIFRVLKPNGKLIFYDVFKGEENEIYYPVPWADNSLTDFLIGQSELKDLIESFNFKINYWKDITDLSRDWYGATVTKMKNRKPYPLGLHLVMGENANEKFRNMVRNLNESKISVAQAVAEKEMLNSP